MKPLRLDQIAQEARLRPVFQSEKPAVVIFPVSHAVGLSVIRTLEDHDIPILALDFKPRAAGLYSRHVTPLLVPELGEGVESFEAGMLAIGRCFRTAPVLFLVDDEDLFLSLKHADRWSAVYRLPLSGWPVVSPIVNKGALYRSLAKVGYPIPETWFAANREELIAQRNAIQFPCIVKPTYSTAFRQRFGVKAKQFGEFEALLAFADEVFAAGIEFVVQEFIDGPATELYTYAAYSDDDGEVIASFTGRKLHQYPPDFGTCRLGESVFAADLEEVGARLLKILRYRGISLTEFKRDPRGGYRLIELNPRPGDWPERLAQLCNANLVHTAYRASIGEAVERQRGNRYGVKWVNLFEDAYYCLRGYRLFGFPEEHRGFWKWLRELRGLETDAFWSWRDPKPALVRLRGMIRDFVSRERERRLSRRLEG